jgi:glycosyltransferase involved in cell wall biosynthesis
MAGTLRPRLTSWWQGARDGRSQGAEAPGKEINVLFYRDYQYFTGGHLKVWHYCEHVRHTPGFRPLIAFSPSSRWDATNPWLSQRDQVLPVWDPRQADLLFLAGMDWLMLGEAERWSPPRPVINLIQHVRHADCDEALYAFLPHPALRICVSAEVAQALRETGRVNGPLMTIPNGIDLDDLPPSPPWEARDVDVLIVGIKQPALAAELSHRLLQAGWRLDPLVTPVPRQDFLRRLARSRVALLLPNPREGFYLPALEGMALGTLVVCPDCVGNRSFCHAGHNCLQPPYRAETLIQGIEEVFSWAPGHREAIMARGHATALRHSLDAERQAFAAILRRLATAETRSP